MKKYAVGVDLGGTKILCALVEKNNGKIIYSLKKKTKNDRGPQMILSKLDECLKELFDTTKVNKEEVSSIGVAAAGIVDKKKGILVNSVNLECQNLDLKYHIENEFDIPAYLLNDVEAATLAELKLGAGAGYKDFVCVFVGTGIGSSLVLGGKIYNGSCGFAGEFGHVVVDSGGRPCACGGNGCLEAYASRSAIEQKISGAVKKGRKSVIYDLMEEGKNMSSKYIKEALDAHDEVVSGVIGEACEYLSAGLASLINLLNPKLIILGGGLIECVDEFYLKTLKLARSKSLPDAGSVIEFKKAALGDFSGVIGAAIYEGEENE